MRVKEAIAALEQFAPLPLQDGYDNAGLQVGVTEAEVSGVLLCLDVTESVLEEAVSKGCNLVVAHHPLVFHPLSVVGDATYVERCVRFAIKHDLTIYAAHTNLDNAIGGVSYEMANRLGLVEISGLRPSTNGGASGVVGVLETPMPAKDFVNKVKTVFGVKYAMCNALLDRLIRKVALCGGAGDFLLQDAVDAGADAFITGEMHYHRYFGQENIIQIITIGHYESERYTINLLQRILQESFPNLNVAMTSINTNPIVIV